MFNKNDNYYSQDKSGGLSRKKLMLIVAVGFVAVVLLAAILANRSSDSSSSKLKTYKNGSFSISYPSYLSAKAAGDGVSFSDNVSGHTAAITVSLSGVSNTLSVDQLKTFYTVDDNGDPISGVSAKTTKVNGLDALEISSQTTQLNQCYILGNFGSLWLIKVDYSQIGGLAGQTSRICGSFRVNENA